MNTFPTFIFDANQFSGKVESREELEAVFKAYKNIYFDRAKLLDNARNKKIPGEAHNYGWYGLGSGYFHGDKTLRQFLTEHGVDVLEIEKGDQ